MNVIIKVETPDLFAFLFSEIFAIAPLLDPTLETDSVLEIKILHIDVHQDHLPNLFCI